MGCGPSKQYVDNTFIPREEVEEEYASRDFMKDTYIQKTELEMEAMDPRSFVAQTVQKSVETQILASQRELDALGKRFTEELQEKVDVQLQQMKNAISTFVAQERARQKEMQAQEARFIVDSEQRHARLGDRLVALGKVQAVVEDKARRLREELKVSEETLVEMNEKVWKTFHLFKCHCPPALHSGYDMSKLALVYATNKEEEDPEDPVYEETYKKWEGEFKPWRPLDTPGADETTPGGGEGGGGGGGEGREEAPQ